LSLSKREFSWILYDSDNKGKLHEGNQVYQLGFPHTALYPVHLKAIRLLSFVQLIKMSQFRPLSGNNERVCL